MLLGRLAGSSVTASLGLLRATAAGATQGGGGGGIRNLNREKYEYLRYTRLTKNKGKTMIYEQTFLLLSPRQHWVQEGWTPDELDPLERWRRAKKTEHSSLFTNFQKKKLVSKENYFSM